MDYCSGVDGWFLPLAIGEWQQHCDAMAASPDRGRAITLSGTALVADT